MTKPTLVSEQLGRPACLVARAAGRDLLLGLLETSPRLAIRAGEPPPPPRRRQEPDPDPEAIHDFRVALRRLRSWLQAFRPFLGESLRRRSEKRLGRLSRIAGPARDLEVGRALLLEMAGAGQSVVAVEARRVAGRLQPAEFRARRTVVRMVVEDLSADAARVAEQLHPIDVLAANEPTMAAVLASLLRRRLKKVRNSLSRLVRGSRMESYHSARIAAKRLRYLLEAFDGTSRLAAGAVHRLSALQDALGELNDYQVLLRRVTEEGGKVVLRRRLYRRMVAARRRAYRLSRSRDVQLAWDATERLIHRLLHNR